MQYPRRSSKIEKRRSTSHFFVSARKISTFYYYGTTCCTKINEKKWNIPWRKIRKKIESRMISNLSTKLKTIVNALNWIMMNLKMHHKYSKYLVLFLCNSTIQITLISNIILQVQNVKQLHIKSGTNSKPTSMLVDKETAVS